MKDKPNKGWLKELAKNPVNSNEKDPFTWSKPVSSRKADIDDMNTPKRLSNHKAVKPSKMTSVDEHKLMQKKRGRTTWK